ncbi:MAG: hypothetical protein QOI66_4268 [Myxococcales bacterium]|nr:hypothetical protein [Myxococcales bacterium]
MAEARALTSIVGILLTEQVDFVLVGALAAVTQGAPVTTHDVDIVHARTAENLPRSDPQPKPNIIFVARCRRTTLADAGSGLGRRLGRAGDRLIADGDVVNPQLDRLVAVVRLPADVKRVDDGWGFPAGAGQRHRDVVG